MKSINFKHPKYVIPLIALPFLIGLFWLYNSEVSKAADVETAEETVRLEQEQQVNANIQEPSDKIQGDGIQDKFEAYSDRYKRDKDYSAIQGLREDQFTTSLESQYTDEELLALDSMQRMISKRTPSTISEAGAAPAVKTASHRMVKAAPARSGNKNLIPPRNKSQQDQDLERALAQINRQSGSTGAAVTKTRSAGKKDDPYERQLETFKMQMNYMDSLEKARDPKYQAMLAAEKKAEVPKQEAVKETKATTYATGTPSPAAKKILDEGGVKSTEVKGNGVSGRVTKEDALNAVRNKANLPQREAFSRNERREKMSRLRKTISERLVFSKNSTAMLTTFNEIDMTAINHIRAKYGETFKKKNEVSLGIIISSGGIDFPYFKSRPYISVNFLN